MIYKALDLCAVLVLVPYQIDMSLLSLIYDTAADTAALFHASRGQIPYASPLCLLCGDIDWSTGACRAQE